MENVDRCLDETRLGREILNFSNINSLVIGWINMYNLEMIAAAFFSPVSPSVNPYFIGCFEIPIQCKRSLTTQKTSIRSKSPVTCISTI